MAYTYKLNLIMVTIYENLSTMACQMAIKFIAINLAGENGPMSTYL